MPVPDSAHTGDEADDDDVFDDDDKRQMILMNDDHVPAGVGVGHGGAVREV